MKKQYETPKAEMVKFQYRDQVVAASGKCDPVFRGNWYESYTCTKQYGVV